MNLFVKLGKMPVTFYPSIEFNLLYTNTGVCKDWQNLADCVFNLTTTWQIVCLI